MIPDPFTPSESALHETLFALQERAQAAEAVAQRCDEGLLALELRLSKYPAQNAACLTPMQVMIMVGAVAQYASSSLRADWIDEMLAEVERMKS